MTVPSSDQACDAAPPSEPLAQAIIRVCNARKEQEALCILTRGNLLARHTGAELLALAFSHATRLKSLRGRSVVLCYPPLGDFIPVLLGCLLAGVTAIPVPPPRRGSASARLVHIINEARPAAVLCAVGAEPAILADIGEGADVPILGWCHETRLPPTLEASGPAQRLSIEEMLGGQRIAIIQYTSGSTQSPKGVLISETNILENAALVMRSWGLNKQSRSLNWMPHFHDMGLMGGILYPLLCGGLSVQMSPLDFIRNPRLWLQAICDWGITFSGGPSFAFMEVIRRVSPSEFGTLDLSTWRRAFCGAEPIPESLLKDFAQHLAPANLRREAVFACYGMAEITLFAAGTPQGAGPDGQAAIPSPDCVLTPELATLIAIIDPLTGASVAEGETGEICITGPSQGAGYLNRPKETAQNFGFKMPGRSGVFLRTGDLGRIAAGRLSISGRIKDVIFAHGLTIPAAEVEQLACAPHSALNPMAAAVFMHDAQSSGEAVLFVELHNTRKPVSNPQETKDQMRRKILGEWGLDLVDIRFVPSGHLPRTTSGKIRRSHVADLYRTRDPALLAERAQT